MNAVREVTDRPLTSEALSARSVAGLQAHKNFAVDLAGVFD